MKINAAIFDLDFTIINSNSTFDFIYFYIKQKKSYKKLIKAFLFLFFERLGVLTQGIHKIKKPMFLNFLKGESLKDINNIAEEYFSRIGKNIINPQIMDEFLKLKNQGFKTILASSSLHPVVAVFSKNLNFDHFFASHLNFRGGICLGSMDDILEKKKSLFNHFDQNDLFIDLENSYFFSDNEEDLEIFKIIKNSYAVVSDPVIAKKWGDSGIKTFFINPTISVDRKIFFIPLSYYWISRASKGIRHFLVHYIGLPLLALILFGWPISFFDILFFFLSYCTYMSIYEIGYFVNDTISIKNEKKPNLRAGSTKLGNLAPLVFSRFFVFICLSLLLVFLKINITTFLIGTLFTFGIFFLHNLNIKKIKIFTFSLLKLSHYIVPLLIFSRSIYIPTALLFILLQLPEEILFYTKRKYREDEPDLSEVKKIIILPTLFILLLIILFLIFDWSHEIFSFFVLSFYLFLYKFISFSRKTLIIKII